MDYASKIQNLESKIRQTLIDELVAVPKAMHFSADRAVSRFLSIVDSMIHRVQRSQVCEDGLQVFITHITEVYPRHHRVELASLHQSGANGLYEKSLVVVRDP